MKSALSCALFVAASSVSAHTLAQGYGQSSPYGGNQSDPYGSGSQGANGSGSQGAYGGQQQSQPGSLEAGGLTAPGAMDEPQNPESAEQRRELDKAEEADSGRGLEWFYINAEAGVQHLGLQTFEANNLIDAEVVETSQTGFLFGAGLGLRLVFITVGPRFRLATFSDYQVWTLNGELGLRIPIGSVEPYFTVGAGYASLGSFSAGNVGSGLTADAVDITGYDIRAGGGLDIYVTPVFSIGGSLTFEMLGLTRPGVSPQDLQAARSGQPSPGTADSVYAADGSSLGSALTGTLVLGLHF